MTFEKVRLLAAGDDREASLRLGADALQVVDGKRTLDSAAYRDVIGLFHSHSREPKWATPDGTSVPVAKAGGKFSFLKGAPDWITVQTRTAFIPLRVQGDDRERVIAALEARIGMKVVARGDLTMFTVCYNDADGTATRVNLPEGETLIGRGTNCQILINVASVSRQHARLRVSGARCTLSDAGSSYGTQVNGTSLKGETDLKAGDVFHCGAVVFTLESR